MVNPAKLSGLRVMLNINSAARTRVPTSSRLVAILLIALALPKQVSAQDAPADRGKLLLTNGATSIEGSAGGGLATWAVIAGNGTQDEIGISGHATVIELPDYGWLSFGVAVGLHDRLELSYARQNIDTRDVGAALGLGQGYTFHQDIYGAKLRLFGDAVYGDALMPQVSVGIHHKRSGNDAIVRAVGAADDEGTDIYLTATKLFLSHSVLASGTVRWTEGNQGGLLGFGNAGGSGGSVQIEGSLAYQLSRRLVIGGEYRTRPDNLAVAQEDDAYDLFAAWAVTRNVTLTGAYADLGSIVGQDRQRGGYVSVQLAF